MKTKLTLLLIVSLFLKSGLAEAGVGEKAFGATIKTVVKGVIAVTNIENVKKKIVAKLEATDDEYYNLRYSNFYHLIKDLPSDIRTKYKITPRMSKYRMIENIKSVDKKNIHALINRIPSETISDLFKQYLSEVKSPKKTKPCYKSCSDYLEKIQK